MLKTFIVLYFISLFVFAAGGLVYLTDTSARTKGVLVSGFLFLVLCATFGCAAAPTTTKFDGRWRIIQQNPTSEKEACLPQSDVLKLREILIRCEKKDGN